MEDQRDQQMAKGDNLGEISRLQSQVQDKQAENKNKEDRIQWLDHELSKRRQRCGQRRQVTSKLEQAFDQCPSVLLPYFSDVDAARLASALCLPQFLVSKRYEIKRTVSLRAWRAGLYPCVVRRMSCDDPNATLADIPSTVTAMLVRETEFRRREWQVSELPRSLTDLEFNVQPGRLLMTMEPKDWPPHLTSLCLTRGTVPLSRLPLSLRHLSMQADEIDGKLPSSLTSLALLSYCPAETLRRIPSHVTTLAVRLQWDVRPNELGALPDSLTHLTLHGSNSQSFRQAALKFPASLRYLHLDSLPYQALPNLPSSLEYLCIENSHNLKSELPPLPPSLTELHLRNSSLYNFPIRHASLRKLTLPGGFQQPIRASDCPNLVELCLTESAGQDQHGFDREYDHPLDSLPASLKKLEMNRLSERAVDKLPEGLTELHLFSFFYDAGPRLHSLPSQLQVLQLQGGFDQPLDALPDTLSRLEFGHSSFNRRLDRLPDSLEVLVLSRDFDHCLDHLPRSLRVLQFRYRSDFNQPLDRLPDALTVLRLGRKFNQPFLRLPRGLTELTFSWDCPFNYPLPLASFHDRPSLLSGEFESKTAPASSDANEAPAPLKFSYPINSSQPVAEL